MLGKSLEKLQRGRLKVILSRPFYFARLVIVKLIAAYLTPHHHYIT